MADGECKAAAVLPLKNYLLLSSSLELCNEPLITVKDFSVYSYCFNYMWGRLECASLALRGGIQSCEMFSHFLSVLKPNTANYQR